MYTGKINKDMTVWSGQTDIVCDTLQRKGRYVVKKQYVEQKYVDTAWIFQEAYSFLARAAEKLILKPEEAESPVWVYPCVHNIYGGSDMHYLKLVIPPDHMLLFDIQKWNKVLNLRYIGTDDRDEQEFENWLKSRGISDNLKIFSTPYYILEKQKIKESWSRLFQYEDIDEQYLQGMVWEIRNEWISEIR